MSNDLASREAMTLVPSLSLLVEKLRKPPIDGAPTRHKSDLIYVDKLA